MYNLEQKGVEKCTQTFGRIPVRIVHNPKITKDNKSFLNNDSFPFFKHGTMIYPINYLLVLNKLHES